MNVIEVKVNNTFIHYLVGEKFLPESLQIDQLFVTPMILCYFMTSSNQSLVIVLM